MKKIIIAVAIVLLYSCQQRRKHDLQMEELEYLKLLYEVQNNIKYEQKIKILDSLIDLSNKRLDELKDTEL